MRSPHGHPIVEPAVRRGRHSTSAVAAFVLACCVIAAACASPTTQTPPASSPPGSTALTVPLPPFDPEAFRSAEAELRKVGREKAGLAKLGPGALELASLMDRTASFLLTKSQSKLIASGGAAGRLAAPLSDVAPPGAPILGAYLLTTIVFPELITKLIDKSPPGSLTADSDHPTTDTVTVGGNKGTITTSHTASAGFSGSRVSLLIQIKVSGEVRDAATGALLYKVASEATGNASGDVCPDASGVARAQFTFRGHEDFFDATGAKTSTAVDEGFGGELRIKADDNAKLAGVDVTNTGGFSAAGSLAEALAARLMEMTAQNTAPRFEKAWRSGICVEVLVDPESRDVDPASITTVNVKVKHKIDGAEIDKPVEAKLSSGVKSIDPSATKQKAPAIFRFTAGSDDGDFGFITFESVSNRGIGDKSVTYTVAKDSWTINGSGTYTYAVTTQVGSGHRNVQFTIKDLKLTGAGFGIARGSGTLTLHGGVSSGPFPSCTGDIDETFVFTADGTTSGTGPGAVMRLTLDTADPGDHAIHMLCTIPGIGTLPSTDEAGVSQDIGDALGEFELPASGGTKTVTHSEASQFVSQSATATLTVVRK
jgi:hypothetical protein